VPEATLEELLRPLREDPAHCAVLLDVDGVLAPIVEQPDDAHMPETTRRPLIEVAKRFGIVACVTGRPSEVARGIVGVEGLTYVGEHGLELDPDARDWAERIHGFAVEVPWSDIEVKPLSVAFHYRTAPDPDAARRELEPVAAGALDLGFRSRWGRMVLEVLPPVEASKGTAVRRLLEQSGLRRALYAGDDTTDLDGFAALDGLDAAVRVAVVSAEGPAELGERADVIVGSPESFRELLEQL